MKRVIKFIKRFIISAFVLYGYNLISVPTGLIIPINAITILILTIFGLPALFALITVLFFVY